MDSKIHNLIILDRSGSMTSISEQAVEGVNRTINSIKDSIKENEGQTQYISLVSFCGCHTDVLMRNVNANEARTLSMKDYSPCCTTPLYDAIGESCTTLEKFLIEEPMTAVNVTIITDGYENASTKWSHPDIVKLISRLKEKGWLFAYIGADHDVESVAFSLHIDNHMKFDKSNAGTKVMFDKMNASRKEWAKSVMLESSMLEDNDDASFWQSKLGKLSKNFFDK